jgi:hypothetical protein
VTIFLCALPDIPINNAVDKINTFELWVRRLIMATLSGQRRFALAVTARHSGPFDFARPCVGLFFAHSPVHWCHVGLAYSAV